MLLTFGPCEFWVDNLPTEFVKLPSTRAFARRATNSKLVAERWWHSPTIRWPSHDSAKPMPGLRAPSLVLPRLPCSTDRTRSPARVSAKREYFKYLPETFGNFALRLRKSGDQRPN